MTTFNIVERNHSSLTIVPDWKAFVEWAEDGGGYDETYFDVNQSKCLELQWGYLDYFAEEREERNKVENYYIDEGALDASLDVIYGDLSVIANDVAKEQCISNDFLGLTR